MKKLFFIALLFLAKNVQSQSYVILDSIHKTPISYATISFGNGTGTFADAEGSFKFSKKWYPNVSKLYISSLGHKEITIATDSIPSTILLPRKVDQLNEIIVTAEVKKKFKVKKIASKIHNNYFKCWLPTVESEVAVYFKKAPDKTAKIASLFLPIKTESSDKNESKKHSFSTLFKIQFYSNKKGFPGKRLAYDNIICKITEKDKSNFELNISDYNVYIPKNGIFVSLQVLGYADKEGKLQQTRKYSEIETSRGVVKVSTTFRPLLPFTDKIDGHRTFTRRVFFKNKTWQRFDKEYSKNNNLLKNNVTNYGMGLKLQLYEND